MDQTSQVLRYVLIEGSSVNVVETFVGFLETKRRMVEYISNIIL